MSHKWKGMHKDVKKIVENCPICTNSRPTKDIPLKNKESNTVLDGLTNVFSIIGKPDNLISDRGGEFVNIASNDLLNSFNIKKINTTSYHPQSNGTLERFHKTLMLSMPTTQAFTLRLDHPHLKLCFSEVDLEQDRKYFFNFHQNINGIMEREDLFTLKEELMKSFIKLKMKE